MYLQSQPPSAFLSRASLLSQTGGYVGQTSLHIITAGLVAVVIAVVTAAVVVLRFFFGLHRPFVLGLHRVVPGLSLGLLEVMWGVSTHVSDPKSITA